MGSHRFLQLFLYLFILLMSRDEWTTITQSNPHSVGAISLLLRHFYHSFFLPFFAKTKTFICRTRCHKCSTSLTVSCLFSQYDLILLYDKTVINTFYQFLIMSLVDLNIGLLSVWIHVCKYFTTAFLIAHVALTLFFFRLFGANPLTHRKLLIVLPSDLGYLYHT